jgi:hypothetical protein
MEHQYPKNDKAIIMCGLTGIITSPILAGGWLIWVIPVNLDSLTNRFFMIVLLYCSAPFGALVGGSIGWLAGRFLASDAE